MKRDLKNQNYLRVQIEVDKLKKAEPNLPTARSKEELRNMMQEFSKCFFITEDGELLVDENKVDPSAISIENKELMNFTKEELETNEKNKRKLRELEKLLMRNPASLVILEKTARIFNKVHFLIIVYKQENIVGEDATSSLANYEQYNVNYIVELKNLSNASEKKISFIFTEAHCRTYFGTRDDADVARYITRKLNMYMPQVEGSEIAEKNAILPIVKSMEKAELREWESKGITFYHQRALELIQKYIMNRQFLLAFKKYKRGVKELESQTILRQAINLENNWYHAVVYLSSTDKNFKASLWNAKNYAHFKLKVSKEFSSPFLKYKEEFADALLKSLFFVSDENDQLTLRYNYKGMHTKVSRAIALKKHKRFAPPADQPKTN